jgi:hypothetical protein
MQNKHTNELNYDMNFKSKSSHPQNIWNDDIDDNINDTFPLIPFKNTLNIEKYVLKNDFIIQLCNTFDYKTNFFKDDGFTILSNSMVMDESKYESILNN